MAGCPVRMSCTCTNVRSVWSQVPQYFSVFLARLQLRDCELGAIVNRDLSRRIRSVNGIASHKQVVRSDIKLAARIVHNLDEQRGLWSPDDAEAGQGKGAGKDQQSTADVSGCRLLGFIAALTRLDNASLISGDGHSKTCTCICQTLQVSWLPGHGLIPGRVKEIN